ncbi:PREDICTED: probable FBD-associated F-box protein At1g32375 [Camelina sativa]|uniref:Probable FBD-associated F-box protein At1g32375 n=1 Tax=Camelina sativa TaxID=90675 RepID=A0ABM0XAL2_CAMSA|nr:PREDICTED: probable FBD-associated F-box protein At1g32375 [Camelina sativa]
MDRLSQLPDELLLRILSLLPAKDVVVTMVLSKRWQFLWMFVPKLVYDDSYQDIDYGRFSRFVDRCLILHKAPVLETLHFKLGQLCDGEDIHVWIRAANKCSVRELIIEIDTSFSASPAILPRSFYTESSMLVSLSLNNVILLDVYYSVSFPSLKTLGLLAVKYPGNEFVNSLLSNCHVLEDLGVEQCADDNVNIFTVKVPSLKSLALHSSDDRVEDDAQGFVIDAPSLEWLDLVDYMGGFCVIESNMPKIVQAYIDVTYSLPQKILSCITSVQHLDLCLLTSQDAYPVGSIFPSLVCLKICTCETEWLNLLMRVIKDSPKLRALKLGQSHDRLANQTRSYWSEPSSVPECVLTNLETLEWLEYEGIKEEKEVAAYILRTGSCLKKVTIKPKSTSHRKKLEMIKELSFSPRSSPSCRLSFD